jgi:hypothetical protein
MRFLLRWYPPAWRERYGAELEHLIEDGGDVSWRMKVDVIVGGLRERLRPPESLYFVLIGWVLMTVAGLVVQKTSEQWQQSTGGNTAFDALKVAAMFGSAFVIAGILAAVPALITHLRTRGWPSIRGPIIRAAAVTTVALAATAGLVAWANQLTAAERNGTDLGYSLGFLAWASLLVLCLVLWASAAIATGRQLDLSTAVIKLEAWLSAGVAASTLGVTVATLTWWAQTGVGAAWMMAWCAAAMLVATALAGVGAARSIHKAR